MTRWFKIIFVSASFKDTFIWFKKEFKSSLFVFILDNIDWNNCSCFESVAYLKQLYYDLIVGIDLIWNLCRFIENYICGLHGCCVGDWSFCWNSFNDYFNSSSHLAQELNSRKVGLKIQSLLTLIQMNLLVFLFYEIQSVHHLKGY